MRSRPADSPSLTQILGVCQLAISIGSLLIFSPAAFPREGSDLQASRSIKACSEGPRVSNESKFVRIPFQNVDDSKTSSVSVRELKQYIPRKAKKAFHNGIKALQEGRPADSQQFIIEALKIEPTYFQASALLADLLFNANKYPAARIFAERAHRLNPDYTPALEILGALDVLDGRLAQGISELIEVTRYAPTRQEAHYYLGVALLRNGQCGDGSRHLETSAYLRDHASETWPHPRLDPRPPASSWPTWHLRPGH